MQATQIVKEIDFGDPGSTVKMLPRLTQLQQYQNTRVHPGSQAGVLGRQRSRPEHRHTDRVKVGWEVFEVAGAGCTVDR